MRQPDFDIDRAKGAQAELWVMDLRKAFAEKARIEVKAPEPFLREQTVYVEYKCRGRDGVWRPSGISVTRAALQFFKFGSLPGGLVVETDWLKRACKIAYQKPAARKQCSRGSNPTLAVVVGLADLWLAREHDP
jgi:hypothetical protein